MVSASALGKRFRGEWVFRGLEFTLSRGECLLVTGRNGSGKSTLLRIIAGLETATSGCVSLPADDRRRSLGYSGPELRLYPELSCGEHLTLAAKLRGVAANVDSLLQRVGLAEHGTKRARELSSGMRSRLRLGLAIQAQPEVLILDEPSIALDDAGRRILESVAFEQLDRGCTILATNDAADRRLGSLELRLGE